MAEYIYFHHPFGNAYIADSHKLQIAYIDFRIGIIDFDLNLDPLLPYFTKP